MATRKTPLTEAELDKLTEDQYDKYLDGQESGAKPGDLAAQLRESTNDFEQQAADDAGQAERERLAAEVEGGDPAASDNPALGADPVGHPAPGADAAPGEQGTSGEEGISAELAEARRAIEMEQKRADDEMRKRKEAEGRHGGALQKIEQLEKATAAPASDAPATPKPTQSEMNAALKDDESWEKFRDDFPDWAEAVDKRFDAKIDARLAGGTSQGEQQAGLTAEEIEANVMQKLRTEQAAEAQKAADAAFDAECKLVDDAHGSVWRGVVKGDEFKFWLVEQTPEVKALYNSESGADAIKMMDKYKADKGYSSKTADQIKQERQNRLSRSAMPNGGQGVQQRTGIKEDDLTEDQYWDYLEAQDEKAGKATQVH